jgi:hypothetical protein
LAATALLGLQASTKWAYAFLGYAPMLLFFCLPASPPPALRRKALVLTYVVLAAFGAGVAIKNLGVTAATTTVDGRALARALKTAWSETTPLRYVGGNIHLVSRPSTYLPERPRPIWDLDPRATVWEDEKAVRAAGVLVLALSEEEYQAFQARWPGLPAPRRLNWPFRAPLSRKEATLTIFQGVALDPYPTDYEAHRLGRPRPEAGSH